MKKFFVTILAAVVLLGVFGWLNRFLTGMETGWPESPSWMGKGHMSSDRRTRTEMQQVLDAFQTEDKLVEKNKNAPGYWVHIEPKTGGSPIDMLVWLAKGEPASYVHGALGDPLSMGQAYPIPDSERDQLLKLLDQN